MSRRGRVQSFKQVVICGKSPSIFLDERRGRDNVVPPRREQASGTMRALLGPLLVPRVSARHLDSALGPQLH